MILLWLALGIIGAVVLFLVFNEGGTAFFGLQNSTFAESALLSMWAALIASAVIPRKGEFRKAARNAVAWILIILLLSGGYIFRFQLQDIASRMTAGQIPGSPQTIEGIDGRPRIVLKKASGGHFVARTLANGKSVTMLVDTGATTTVLSQQTATSIGIEPSSLSFSLPVQTANGTALAARARISDFQLGSISRSNMLVLVAQAGALERDLLGMNFLNTLSSFEFRGDSLILTE